MSASTLLTDTFEGSLGNWSVAGGAFHYTHSDSGINYATRGDGAAAVTASWDEGLLTLTKSLKLSSNQATSVTINFDFEWDSTTATRYMYIDYSTDDGRTWTDDLGDISGWGSFAGLSTLGSFTKTLDERTVGSFTDDFKFRIRGKDGDNPVTAYIDNIEIVGANVVQGAYTKDDIPEPSTLAIIFFGLSIAVLQRPRR